MFEKLGHLVVRRRKAMVVLFVVAVLAAGGVGSMVFNRLDSGGYSNPNSDSYEVYNYLNKNLKISDPYEEVHGVVASKIKGVDLRWGLSQTKVDGFS